MNKPERLHLENWTALQASLQKQRLSQVLLFTGSASCRLDLFLSRFLAWFFCTAAIKPCTFCPSCQMIENNQHPDLQWIAAEKKSGPIKIDQIRVMQERIYQKPQLASAKCIVIQEAEYLNLAAANALLKILEEPPAHAHFVLTCSQIATLPATIISRCQIWRFHPDNNNDSFLDANLETEELKFKGLIESLLNICTAKIHYSELAEQWKNQDQKDLLNILYAINAELIRIKQTAFSKNAQPLASLAAMLDERTLFAQIDKINTIQKKLIHHLQMNMTLVLEDLLIDYQRPGKEPCS